MTLDNSLINDPFMYSYTLDYNAPSITPVTYYSNNNNNNNFVYKTVSLNNKKLCIKIIFGNNQH